MQSQPPAELDGLTYCMVYHRDSTCVRVRADDAATVEDGVLRFLGAGSARFQTEEDRDTLLRLTTTGGASYCTLASAIYSWMIVTPASRAREAAVDAALERAGKAAEPTPTAETPT